MPSPLCALRRGGYQSSDTDEVDSEEEKDIARRIMDGEVCLAMKDYVIVCTLRLMKSRNPFLLNIMVYTCVYVYYIYIYR